MTDFYQDLNELEDEDLLAELKSLRDEAWYANLDWLETAQQAHAFKAGDQWSETEKRKLQLQGREALVWNYIHAGIEVILGTANQNPVRIFPYPTEASDDFLCEILEDIVTYIDSNQLNADAINDRLLESAVKIGRASCRERV